jgi:putative phosphoribosyl transferase
MSDDTPAWPDRTSAGEDLARQLPMFWRPGEAITVVGIPRGGLVVAAPVAWRRGCPLVSWSTRRLVLPGSGGLGLGAVAPGGIVVIDPDQVRLQHVALATLLDLIRHQQLVVERHQRLFAEPQPAEIAGHHLIVIDDYVGSGLTMEATLRSLRQLWPRSITLAVPVAEQGTIRCLRPEVDNLLVLISTEHPGSGRGWFRQLGPVDLRQVQQLLHPRLAGTAGDAPQTGSSDVSSGSSTSG